MQPTPSMRNASRRYAEAARMVDRALRSSGLIVDVCGEPEATEAERQLSQLLEGCVREMHRVNSVLTAATKPEMTPAQVIELGNTLKRAPALV